MRRKFLAMRVHRPNQSAAEIQLVSIVATICIAACTYDFDKFAVGQGAHGGAGGSSATVSATGGAGTQQGGSGGTALATGGTAGTTLTTGGTSATVATGGQAGAGAGGAGTDGGPGPDAGSDGSSISCAGPARGGICWYLGELGRSCQQVCASHGQAAPEAASHVGTVSQGGSLSECATLFGLLGVGGVPTSVSRSDGLGLGCHLYNQAPWWLRTPNFSASSSYAKATLVCGCTQ
jgi:hypothetical protein